jgi:hypothetical protein
VYFDLILSDDKHNSGWKELFNDEEFNDRFMMYNCDHPNHMSFTNPDLWIFLKIMYQKLQLILEARGTFFGGWYILQEIGSEFQIYYLLHKIVDNGLCEIRGKLFFHSKNIEIWSMLNHETGGHKNYDPIQLQVFI